MSTSQDWRDQHHEHYLKWRREHTEKNREQINEYARRWRKKNRAKYNASRRAYSQKWRDAHREQVREYSRAHSRLWLYGLTRTQFEQMWQEQLGLCAICGVSMEGKQENGRTTKCHVDHTERGGVKQVRALLCYHCNVMLGSAHDSPIVLRAAADYLERWVKWA